MRTPSRKTVLLPCMQGLFNYFCWLHSICRIVLLLACSSVCSSKHRMNDTTYCILITPRAASLAEGERRGVIHHARHEARFLSNTFSPTGSLHSTSLIHFFIYWRSLFIYASYPGAEVTVLQALASKSIEWPVKLNILWGRTIISSQKHAENINKVPSESV